MKDKLIVFILLVLAPLVVLAYPKGDINGSGTVDNADYVLLRNHIRKTSLLTGDQLSRADVNGQNGIDIADYVAIRNIILKGETVTPSPTPGVKKNRCCCVTSDLRYCSWRNVEKCPQDQAYEDASVKLCGSTPTPKPTPTPVPTATPTPKPTPSIIGVTSISLSKTGTTLEKGEMDTVTAVVNPANATNKTITWSSNNTGVATVNASGGITAISAGTAILTASAGGKSATVTVTVTNPINRIHFIKQASAKGTDKKLSAGDAILIESNGHFAMVDTGLDNSTDNNFVKNYLQSVGVTKLDFIIITHLHRDHTGGLNSIAKKFPVSKIYVKANAVKGHISISTVKSIAKKNGIKIKNPSKDGYSVTFQQMNIKFYNVAKATLGGANGDSLLEYITVNGYKILLTGDLYNDKNSIKYLTKISKKSAFKNLDLLKMPHHGYAQSAFAGTKSGTYNKEAYQNFNPKFVAVTRGGSCTICTKIGAKDNVVYVNAHNAAIFGFGKKLTIEYK